MAFPESFIEELIARNDIVSVVSSYTPLQKKGSRHFGLCPFHNEKTPSFTVYPDSQSFYCFGCGASGVAGGSLLLIPMACSLFGIPNDIAMQVVGVGFIVGVIQDSCETALNSSTDVLFTATADMMSKAKAAKNNK